MGFKLKSGNGPLAFKNMGSSPAKQGLMGMLGAFGGGSKQADEMAKQTPKVTTVDTTKAQANTNKPGSKNYKGTDKNTDKSHLSTKTTDKKGEVKTKAFKNDASELSKPKPELSAAEKAAKKEKFAQGMRDMGALVKTIGGGSLVEEIQSQADAKVAKADKVVAQKNQDIQNEKDIANTKRTNQLTAQATADLEAEASKLPANKKVEKGGGKNKSNNQSSVDKT